MAPKTYGKSQSSGAYSSVKRRGQGNSRGITITANSLTLTQGAVVDVTTRGQGDGGDVLINGADTVTLAGYGVHGYSSGFYSNTAPTATGKGGVITVNAGNIMSGGTLSTLWQVNDNSTSQLMVHFYTELKKTGVSKAEALHRAQKALLAQAEYQNPYFWAPYILVGNWL